MKPATINIDDWKRGGRRLRAWALLVVWGTFPWPWEPYPVYVMPGENLAARFAEYDGTNMQIVTEVRLLSTHG